MTISTSVQRYAAIKRGLGYKFADQEQMLQKYAVYADRHGDKYTSATQIIEWASSAPSVHRSREWFRGSASPSRCTPKMIAMRYRPATCSVEARRPRPRPHIIAEADIARIMSMALTLPPVASLTPYTYHYLIGLLATTGLRVSEAVGLLESDLTPDGLLIRETKFHKTRLVPIEPSTRDALGEYLALRRRIGGPDRICSCSRRANRRTMRALRAPL